MSVLGTESRVLEMTETAKRLIENVPPLLLELSADLQMLYVTNTNNDMLIVIPGPGGGFINCHRAIVNARCAWFYELLHDTRFQDYATFDVEENRQIMEALIVYMYTGNLCLIESLQVPLLHLRKAAKKYGLPRLRKLLTRVLKSEGRPGVSKSCQYQLEFPISDWRRFQQVDRHLAEFSVDGTDKWYLNVTAEYSEQYLEKHLCLYLERVTIIPNYSDVQIHVANFEVRVVDSLEVSKFRFAGIRIFDKDCQRCLTINRLPPSALVDKAEDFLNEGVLRLKLQLTISLETASSPTTFKITNEIEKDVVEEMHALSYDIHKMLLDEKYYDVSIFIGGTEKNLKVHSYFLYARTLVPTPLNGKLMGCFGDVVWKSFVDYLYSGETQYLDNHMREIYIEASRLQLSTLQKKYSRILASQLTADNVFNILSYAKAFSDTELEQSALSFIAQMEGMSTE